MASVLAVQRLERLGRVAPDHVKARLGQGLANYRHQPGDRPLGGGDVRGIVHLSGEDQLEARHRGQARLGLDHCRVEGFAVDPVAQCPDIADCPVSAGKPRAKQVRFVLRNEQAAIGPCGKPRFLGLEQSALAAIDPGARARAIDGIGLELGRIDIDEIEDHPALEPDRHILAHLPREDIDRIDRPFAQDLRDIAG